MSESTNGSPYDGYSETAPEIEPVASGRSGPVVEAERSQKRMPIRSTRSISDRSSTTISIPGTRRPSSESVEKPSFETFLSSPVTLGDHLQRQLAMEVLSEDGSRCRDGDHRQPG